MLTSPSQDILDTTMTSGQHTPPPLNPEYRQETRPDEYTTTMLEEETAPRSTSSEPFVLVPDTRPESSGASITSAPARVDDEVHSLDSHMFSPFAEAVPAEQREPNAEEPEIILLEEEVLGGEVSSDKETYLPEGKREATIPINVEEMDDKKPSAGDQSCGRTSQRIARPHAHCWLIAYLKRWVWKTKQYSKVAAKKCKPQAKRTVHAVKDASRQSAQFVKTKSAQFKTQAVEFNEKHQVGSKARYSCRMVGRQAKKASKSTVKGVKRASSATVQSVKDFEAKHQWGAKSRCKFRKGQRAATEAWNGKHANAGAA